MKPLKMSIITEATNANPIQHDVWDAVVIETWDVNSVSFSVSMLVRWGTR